MNHRLIYSFSGESMRVSVDEKLLQRALINLLTNALKYSPEGSTVHFDLAQEADQSVIHVRDSEIGIRSPICPICSKPFTVLAMSARFREPVWG